MHKRALFVTNSSSCCEFIWGFKIPEDTNIDYGKYAQYMRRVYERYHSALNHNLPVQIQEVEYSGSYVVVDESVWRIHDDDAFRALGDMSTFAEWYNSLVEFCEAVEIPMPPNNEIGWFGGIIAC